MLNYDRHQAEKLKFFAGFADIYPGQEDFVFDV